MAANPDLKPAFPPSDTGGTRSSSEIGHDLSDSNDVGALQTEVQRLKAELERVELALEAAQMEANATQESKERFLSQVAHELRTPLSAIVLWSSLIEDEKVTDPKHLEHAVNAIRVSAEEQRVLIDNLLEMSRILSGRIDLERKQVNLREVVHSAVENIRTAANQKGLSLTENAPESSEILVRGDTGRLEQALANLLTNAVQVTPKGGTVQVELRGAADTAEISVTDSGRGFASESLPQMLRGAPADRRAQTAASYGLGLPIARKISELHNGELRAESAGENRGARFTIRLPLLS